MQTSNLIYRDNAFLTEEEIAAIQTEMHHYEDARAASIGALKIVQSARGWVPDAAIPAIAAVLGIPDTDVEGVATFYSQIFRVPVGRHIIRVCDSMTCYIAGHESVLKKLHELLGIQPGQTTADQRFTLLPVCCLGSCDKSPVVMIDEHTHTDVTPEQLPQILETYP